MHDAPTALARELGRLVHGRRTELGLSQAEPAQRCGMKQPQISRFEQDAYLDGQGVRVRRGDLGEREFPIGHLADGRQIDPQFPQGPHEFEARDGVDGVAAVSGRGAVGRRHDAAIGVEPNGLDTESGPPGDFPDRVERAAVHGPSFASPATGDSRRCGRGAGRGVGAG